MTRIIFHVDVNNAFLSWTAVNLLKNGYEKDIRTIPSVIGGDEEKRHGIVLAKSPIAKKYGVVTAETLYSARKKCPNLEIYAPDYEYYMEMSSKFYHYLKEYTPIIAQVSVDECFMDLSDTNYLYDDILKLAYKIKNDIKEQFGFTVNVGIANNKLCAKMASDFEKPDKVHTLFDYEVKDKMWPLPVGDLLFIGKSSVKELERLGIHTIGDLANYDELKLQKYFKNRAHDMILAARGIDNSKVEIEENERKCISISRTLPFDTLDEKFLKKILLNMANQVGIRARKMDLSASTVAITFKTKSFKPFSHQLKLVNATNNTMDIYHALLKLYDEIPKKEEFRSIGVRLADLESKKREQISLFEEKRQDDNLQKLMDDINSKYKDTTILPAVFFEVHK